MLPVEGERELKAAVEGGRDELALLAMLRGERFTRSTLPVFMDTLDPVCIDTRDPVLIGERDEALMGGARGNTRLPRLMGTTLPLRGGFPRLLLVDG